MSRLAGILSRIVWWWSLWLMRRPWMKGLQRKAINLIPKHRRAKSRASILRQNRFARRWGLPVINLSITLLLASIVLSACFQVALYMYDSGVLTMSSELRDRVEEGS